MIVEAGNAFLSCYVLLVLRRVHRGWQMNFPTLLRSLFLSALSLTLLGALAVRPSLADSGHARIIRLSLTQGDVRIARETHGDDPFSDKVNWEAAELNLPSSMAIRTSG